MEFLIWLAGIVILFFVLNAVAARAHWGSAGVGVAFVVFGGWTVIMVVVTVVRVLMHLFGIHGISIY